MQISVYKDMTETEKQVANYLKELGLWWAFESPVFVYDDKERPRVWTPDFYIPKLGMYVEVWCSENISHEYRERIYRKNGYNVIFVHCYKREKWKSFLVKRIMGIEESRHSEVIKMFNSLV
ncbi:hypothetical protein MUP77_23945 [Candidatus Bathyarchaeota archaeon]|nr:hypothetical protein [Candidatus Bathyarchaeota archaeon]